MLYSRYIFIPLVVLASLSLGVPLPARCWASWGPAEAAEPTPKFAVVPLEKYKEGQGQVRTLQHQAETETFLERMLGINCYSRAVKELQKDCKSMEPDQKSRLALRLANCQLATQGHSPHNCGSNEPLRRCVDRLPDRDHVLYVEFLTHTDAMCLFIQNQEFEKYTETMLSRLAEGAGFAREQLTVVGKHTLAIVGDTTAILAASEDAAKKLKEHGEAQKATIQRLKEHQNESSAALDALASSQRVALRLAGEQVLRTQQLGEAQESVRTKLAAGQAQVEALFSMIEEKAEAVAHAQSASAAAQQGLGEQLKALADGSTGLRSAVDALSFYQQRSDAALIKLLGRSYSLEDAAFYAAGALVAGLTGASRATRRARLPLFILLGACLATERTLVDGLAAWLDVDASGNIMFTLPLPWWFSDPGIIRMNFRGAVRRVCVCAGAALLALAAYAYRDFERANHTLLLEIREEQRRQEETLRKLQLEYRMKERLEALQAASGRDQMRGGGRPSFLQAEPSQIFSGKPQNTTTMSLQTIIEGQRIQFMDLPQMKHAGASLQEDSTRRRMASSRGESDGGEGVGSRGMTRAPALISNIESERRIKSHEKVAIEENRRCCARKKRTSRIVQSEGAGDMGGGNDAANGSLSKRRRKKS